MSMLRLNFVQNIDAVLLMIIIILSPYSDLGKLWSRWVLVIPRSLVTTYIFRLEFWKARVRCPPYVKIYSICSVPPESGGTGYKEGLGIYISKGVYDAMAYYGLRFVIRYDRLF